MERIITLLREKNHYLEKFAEVNDRELLHFESGNFDNVEDFYRTRDKILDLVRVIDDLIIEENEKYDAQVVCSAEHRVEIQSLLDGKDEWVKKILSQDLQVLSWVEKEKSNIIRELQSVTKGRKAIHGYHSGNVRNVVDEKA